MTMALSLAVLPGGSALAEVLGPDAGHCRAGTGVPAFLVRVVGFKAPSGTLRVQLYGGEASTFLAKGKWLRRIDLPVRATGPIDVCVRAPGAGRYAIAVRHDVNDDGKSGWDDGGGFSRNPKLNLLHLKPEYRDVAVIVGDGAEAITIVLNYRRGLSIGPIR